MFLGIPVQQSLNGHQRHVKGGIVMYRNPEEPTYNMHHRQKITDVMKGTVQKNQTD